MPECFERGLETSILEHEIMSRIMTKSTNSMKRNYSLTEIKFNNFIWVGNFDSQTRLNGLERWFD